MSGKLGEYWSSGMDRSRYSCEGRRGLVEHRPSHGSVLLGAYVRDNAPRSSSTWLEVKATMRSRSSTSCLKVGL